SATSVYTLRCLDNSDNGSTRSVTVMVGGIPAGGDSGDGDSDDSDESGGGSLGPLVLLIFLLSFVWLLRWRYQTIHPDDE
ncbi:MAG: hypothetical protein JXA04_01040, partial [Gammaproteobacteria bacterium]|nr:hypothetical protein [Gammaproteobacteria bacterium]